MGMTDRLRVCWLVQKQKRLIWRKLSAQNLDLEWHHTSLICGRSLHSSFNKIWWVISWSFQPASIPSVTSERTRIKLVWCHSKSRFWADNFLHINPFCFCTNQQTWRRSVIPIFGFWSIISLLFVVSFFSTPPPLSSLAFWSTASF